MSINFRIDLSYQNDLIALNIIHYHSRKMLDWFNIDQSGRNSAVTKHVKKKCPIIPSRLHCVMEFGMFEGGNKFLIPFTSLVNFAILDSIDPQ